LRAALSRKHTPGRLSYGGYWSAPAAVLKRPSLLHARSDACISKPLSAPTRARKKKGMRTGRTVDRKTREVPREERARAFGWDRSVDHIRASGHNGCIQRPDTWLHPYRFAKRSYPAVPRCPRSGKVLEGKRTLSDIRIDPDGRPPSVKGPRTTRSKRDIVTRPAYYRDCVVLSFMSDGGPDDRDSKLARATALTFLTCIGRQVSTLAAF
jgi:hypothetical protein